MQRQYLASLEGKRGKLIICLFVLVALWLSLYTQTFRDAGKTGSAAKKPEGRSGCSQLMTSRQRTHRVAAVAGLWGGRSTGRALGLLLG